MNWIHRLFNPHCIHCIEQEEDKFQKSTFCSSCESLKNENNFLRQQNKLLLDKIINPNVSIEPTINTDDLKPLKSYKPFSVIRNELETKDRELARVRDEQLIKNKAAKPDPSPIANDEGKVDIDLVNKELETMNQEIKHG